MPKRKSRTQDLFNGLAALIASGGSGYPKRRKPSAPARGGKGTGRGINSRTRRRNGYAPTQTRTKGSVTNMTGTVSGTKSFYTEKMKGRKLSKQIWRTMCAPQYECQNLSLHTISGIGSQSFSDLVYLMHSTDLNKLKAQIQLSKIFAVGLGNTPNNQNTQFLFVDSVTIQCTISSDSLYPIDIDIYDLKAKGRHGETPAQAVADGLLAEKNIAAGGTASTSFNVQPNESESFRHFWNVRHRTSVNLGAGCVHKHNVNYKFNKKISLLELEQLDLFKTYSRAIMVRQQGYPLHDQVTPANVTIAPTAIDVVTQWTIKYRWGLSTQTTHNYDPSLPVVTLANLEGINEFTSIVKTGDPIG